MIKFFQVRNSPERAAFRPLFLFAAQAKNSLVQHPDPNAKVQREQRPKEVRHHQPRGGGTHFSELQNRQHQQNVQQYKQRHGGTKGPEAEKDERPEEICRELYRVKRERPAAVFAFAVVDLVRGRTHHGV